MHPTSPQPPHRAAPRLLTAGVLAAALALAACGGQNAEDLANAGKAAMAQRDYSAAIIQFKSALQKEPESGDLRLQLGLALLEAGDPVSALVELQKAQELQARDDQVIPPLARALVAVGDETRLLAQYGDTRLTDPQAQADLLTSLATAHLVRNDPARGAELADAALRLVPGYAPATVLQARLRANQADFDAALALLDGVLAREADNERAGVFKGEVLWLGKRDRDAALAAFRAVLAKNPKSVAAHTSTVTILNEQGQRDAARTQFAEMKKVAPNHPDTLFFDAQFAFGDGDYKKSRELTDRLLKGVPDNARVLELAGAADYRQGRYTEAEALLGRALKNAPGRLLSRQLLAQTYLRLNQPAKAVEALRPVLDGKAADGTSLALAGEAYMRLGDGKRADEAFAAAAKAAPDDTRVRTSIALAEVARGGSGAIAKLEAVAAEDKGTRADIALVSARLRANDLPGALKAIDNLEKKQPDKALAHHLRGRVLLLRRDIPAAAKAFETAVAKEPGYFPAIASLAAIDLDAGRPEAARKRFEDHLRTQPNSHQAHLSLAELALRTGGEPAAVLKHLRDAVRANAGEVQPHLMLVNHLLSSGDNAAALTAAREAAAALPTNPQVQETLGRTQLAANDAASAVTTFKQLTSQHGSNPAYQVRLGEALIATNDNTGAQRAMEAALALQPGFMPARRGLVALAMRQNRAADALVLVREMQKADPKDAGGHLLEGDIESSRRNFDAAITAYRNAFNLNKTADTAVRLHMALLGGGRQADADKLAAEWTRGNPKDVGFRYYQGDLALARGEFAVAEGHYRAVLEAQPRNALAMNNVAYLLVRQGKPGALDMAKKANELLPGRPPLMDTMALALAADKKLPQAIELQKSAISRAPNDPSLKLTLARLLIQSGDKAYARAELEELAKLGDKFRDQAEVSKLLASL
jgi:putative PEP-CTERM system TPR-repeat lipoprotein